MMILRPHENRVLMPVPLAQWREPSVAQPKDVFGRPDQTRFRLTARLHDGHPVWRGWLDDRDEADAFLWSLARHIACGDNAPRLTEFGEVWGDPELLPHLSFEFATVVFLTSSAGSNQTYTSPADWNNASNTIECLGAGGGGRAAARGTGANARVGGGGSGEYSRINNFSFANPGTTTATRRVGAAGVGGAENWNGSSSSGLVEPTNGADSWFNGTSASNASCSAKGGGAGDAGGTSHGGSGGSGGVGTVKRSGARGGNLTSSTRSGGTGGGGAPGPSAAGSNGGDSSGSGRTATAGGDGGGGADGGYSSTGGSAGNGSAGSNWDGSHGAGGGGGGASLGSGSTCNGGNGGNYGAGGGAAMTATAGSNSAAAGDGRQGMIVITYDPYVAPKGVFSNMPNMGL